MDTYIGFTSVCLQEVNSEIRNNHGQDETQELKELMANKAKEYVQIYWD